MTGGLSFGHIIYFTSCLQYFIYFTLFLKQNIYFTFLSTKLDPEVGLVLMWGLRRLAKQGFTIVPFNESELCQNFFRGT